MELTFVYSLNRLSIQVPFSLSDKLIVSNTHEFIDQFQLGSEIGSSAGRQRINILKSFPFAVIQFSIENVVHNDIPKRAIAESKDVYNKVYNFVDSLWFVKDCSVTMGDTLETGVVDGVEQYVSIRPSNVTLSMATGEYETIFFDAAEIGIAVNIINKLVTLIYETEKKPLIVEIPKFENLSEGNMLGMLRSPISLSKHNDFSNFRRALLAIQNARSTAILQFKIANYITALECLFTTSKTELQHRIGERLAFFIGGTGEEKRRIYEQVKEAYDVRSSYVHGSDMNNKHQPKIGEIAINIDEIVRKAFVKIILTESQHFLTSKSIDNYFNDLMFPL